ncbi:selenide, water dikinase SelD [Prochlorococcus marinus]|uniref:selenide, water dikinase SelD n=1 Tax=Prochlorococcus marinus TaxID=1219 RepID=UPI001ADBA3A9|nr:selenide, water dikinase SelD [Prochlorococcus marinus]MBO8218511.1 selenide, water dikinase SelD [Prochlorococcus marinus CUG1416]MBW3050919.1 selenide, water dikinase SelD [Prochlorococcus marinus str. MU1416]
MTCNHLVLIGGGHTNVLLIKKWLMSPELIPEIPVSIISRDSYLVYSAMFPSVISKSISLEESLIDIKSLANNAKISFIQEEVKDIDFNLKTIVLSNRPPVDFSKLVLNYGSETKIPREFETLLENRNAFPIKPFLRAYELIQQEDIFDSVKELPFVIVGSGLAAIEVSYALRKRWRFRHLKLLCDSTKINNKILKSLRNSNIELVDNLDSDYGKILLCTGNKSPLWIQKKLLDSDSNGRIFINHNLQLKSVSGIFAAGDCAVIDSSKRPASGIFAVKVVNTLVHNLKKEIEGRSLKKWFPQRFGLQIVNVFPSQYPKAFAIYRNFVFGPSFFIWFLKHKIDLNFIQKFRSKRLIMLNGGKNISLNDCRGCAAKIPQFVLNKSLINSNLDSLASSPEDSVQIYNNGQDRILQSVDGFPALVSDPWLNAKITTLHACSDLWACGAKLSSAQALISLPKVEREFQSYLFSQCLQGIKSTVEDQGGELMGGHTYEARSLVNKPYSLGIDISLTVQGILKSGAKPWLKSGMNDGDVLMMSRPLGVGIYFAGQMQNINMPSSSSEIMKNLVKSQQNLIDEIYFLQDQFRESLVNAATDITGYGFIGHLKEMVESSNLFRETNNLEPIKVLLDLLAFKAYPGVFDLIRRNIKSTFFESNKEIFDKIYKRNQQKRIINFLNKNSLDKETFSERISLLLDPQTCGPLLISCNPKYENSLKDKWYKVGKVVKM